PGTVTDPSSPFFGAIDFATIGGPPLFLDTPEPLPTTKPTSVPPSPPTTQPADSAGGTASVPPSPPTTQPADSAGGTAPTNAITPVPLQPRSQTATPTIGTLLSASTGTPTAGPTRAGPTNTGPAIVSNTSPRSVMTTPAPQSAATATNTTIPTP